ncbi:unnamed protein product [Brachionus calyciflorus]|uniref:Asteroid n=1 Tax=Brachionus calyciflorus TaxID=104777 RepID=A0A814KPG3_9BILA|nr:unnamed protein product [Brachionus calyciflorus]
MDEILEEIKLTSCTLLVDGYSLLYQVHSSSSIQSTHGGNYDELANNLSEILESFKKCNINAIFLLDGGREKSERKIRTQLKRAVQRINNACSITNFASGNSKKGKFSKINLEALINANYHIFSNLLPILAFKVYLDLLKKFEIPHFQCTFEADYDLACLANDLGCPILSSDSDFYVYDLKYGYIPFDYFYISSVMFEDDKYYIPGFIYKIDKFMNHINEKQIEKGDLFKKEMLAIFAVICGNDYVNKSTFSSLLKSFDSSNNNLRFKKIAKHTVNYAKKKDNFYLKILKWLAQFDTAEQCVDMILQNVKNEDHNLIREVSKESIEEYMCRKPSFINYFKKHLTNEVLEDEFNKLNIDEDISSLGITTFNGDLIESNFLKNFIHFKTTRYCLDVLMHRKTLFNCQIEIADWPSSYLSSLEIRKFYYTMLFKLFDAKSLGLKEPVIIYEYLRYQRDLKIYEVNLNEDNFLSLEPTTLDTIFVLKNLFKIEENLISNLILENFSGKLMCKKIKFLFAIIYFWLNTGKQNEDIRVLDTSKDNNFIRAFIVSIIKSSIIDPCYSIIKNDVTPVNDDKEGLKKFEHQDKFLINEFFSQNQDKNANFLMEAKNFLISDSKNFAYLKESKVKLSQFSSLFNQNFNANKKLTLSKIDRMLDLKIVHCLSEFQAIYLSTFYAQTILNIVRGELNDLKFLDLNCFFNGTFLHNFKEELDHRVNPDLYIEEMFGRQSFFKCLYRELFDYFIEVFEIKVDNLQNGNISKNVESGVQEDCTSKQKKNARKNLKRKLKKMENENLSIPDAPINE